MLDDANVFDGDAECFAVGVTCENGHVPDVGYSSLFAAGVPNGIGDGANVDEVPHVVVDVEGASAVDVQPKRGC